MTSIASPTTTDNLADQRTTTTGAGSAPTAQSTTTVTASTSTAAASDSLPRHLIRPAVGTVYSTIDTLELIVPAAEMERIGFHEASHDGARQQDPVPGSVPFQTMETRSRNTGSRTAADIAVNPQQPIWAPVTGRVLRAGGYTLYCDHQDDFVVIEPDARPGWEVKMFHIDGVAVRAGDRVEAGVTILAPKPTQLPFESQLDEFTAEPSWPHVHIEVVDPSIPDVPSGGSGC